jgi:hypothetical protein
MTKSILTLSFCFGLVCSQAQYFLPEMDINQLGQCKEAYVVNMAGDTIRGRVIGLTTGNGQINAFGIKQSDGTKVKYKASAVKVLAVKPTKNANMQSAMSVPSLRRSLQTDYSKVMNREWVYYEQALLPRAKDKYVLMQLLNSGFDSKIKVFLNPNANKTGTLSTGTGLTITGGDDTSYLVVVDGNKSEVYRKMNYKKEAYTELYKDCEAFKDNYNGEDLRWSSFAEHVLVYDQLCK